jgi:hypothetical protein
MVEAGEPFGGGADGGVVVGDRAENCRRGSPMDEENAFQGVEETSGGTVVVQRQSGRERSGGAVNERNECRE